MLNFKKAIGEIIAKELPDLYLEEIMGMIEVPQDAKMGDYAFPCFRLAKELRKAPQQIAADLAEKIKGNEIFDEVEQVNAYVNMFVSKETLCKDTVASIVSEEDKYGTDKVRLIVHEHNKNLRGGLNTSIANFIDKGNENLHVVIDY